MINDQVAEGKLSEQKETKLWTSHHVLIKFRMYTIHVPFIDNILYSFSYTLVYLLSSNNLYKAFYSISKNMSFVGKMGCGGCQFKNQEMEIFWQYSSDEPDSIYWGQHPDSVCHL